MDFQIFAIVSASFIVGAGLGALLSARFTHSAKKTQTVEKHLHDTQDALKNYQIEVTQHFAETAQLLKKMAESYRDVHNHLASGANNLSKDGSGMPMMQKLPEIDTIKGDNEEPTTVRPPLDYAPKHSPYDRGTLSGDYHLEKVELNEKPVNMADALAAKKK